MKVLIVNIRVAKERVGEFVAATRENAEASRKEPGVARFEILQDEADSCHFVLFEAYRDEKAQASHKETPHYRKWKDLAEPMMSEPRTRVLYSEL
jgi:quinol monooxygenase YgiN